jgi:hypothetical protein
VPYVLVKKQKRLFDRIDRIERMIENPEFPHPPFPLSRKRERGCHDPAGNGPLSHLWERG